MKQTQNQFYGKKREIPSRLPKGSSFLDIDNNEMYFYPEGEKRGPYGFLTQKDGDANVSELSIDSGNAIAELFHYSFSTGQDNSNFFEDNNIKLGWDYPGDIEFTMLSEPQGSGDMVSYAKTGSGSVVTKYITEPGTKHDLFPAGVLALEVLVVLITAEQDPLFPSYRITIHNAGSSYNTVAEIKKITPKNQS